MFSETFFTCVQENTWRTCLLRQGRNVIVFDRICHYISDLVYYGRYCVAVSLVHVFFPRRREIEVMWWQREDEGWIRVRLASDSAWCGRGEKKGRKVLAVGESFGERDLSGVLSQAKNPYVSLQIEPALPPELSFKGAPSPTLSQRWIAICVLDMQGGWCRLECSFKILNRNGGAKIHIFITGDLFH